MADNKKGVNTTTLPARPVPVDPSHEKPEDIFNRMMQNLKDGEGGSVTTTFSPDASEVNLQNWETYKQNMEMHDQYIKELEDAAEWNEDLRLPPADAPFVTEQNRAGIVSTPFGKTIAPTTMFTPPKEYIPYKDAKYMQETTTFRKEQPRFAGSGNPRRATLTPMVPVIDKNNIVKKGSSDKFSIDHFVNNVSVTNGINNLDEVLDNYYDRVHIKHHQNGNQTGMYAVEKDIFENNKKFWKTDKAGNPVTDANGNPISKGGYFKWNPNGHLDFDWSQTLTYESKQPDARIRNRAYFKLPSGAVDYVDFWSSGAYFSDTDDATKQRIYADAQKEMVIRLASQTGKLQGSIISVQPYVDPRHTTEIRRDIENGISGKFKSSGDFQSYISKISGTTLNRDDHKNPLEYDGVLQNLFVTRMILGLMGNQR